MAADASDQGKENQPRRKDMGVPRPWLGMGVPEGIG